MSRLRSAYKPFAPEVEELYARVKAGEAPRSIEHVGFGSTSVVFRSRAVAGHLLKLPLAEPLTQRERQKAVRQHVSALSLGHGHRFLEQVTAYDDKILPALVVEEVEGVTMDVATDADLRQIKRPNIRDLVETLDDMHDLGLTIDGESWSNTVVNSGRITLLDYVHNPSEPFSQKLTEMAWMLGFCSNTDRRMATGLAMTYHEVCTDMLPAATVAPLTNMMRDTMRLPV